MSDAAGLLRALGLTPATVFGTSMGASIALELVARHPDVVERAIVHEPPLYWALRRSRWRADTSRS